MEFKKRSLMQIADMICGNYKHEESFFRYRSGRDLTEFFQDCDTDHKHDGWTTRDYWVAATLKEILAEPQPSATHTARSVLACDSHAYGSRRFGE